MPAATRIQAIRVAAILSAGRMRRKIAAADKGAGAFMPVEGSSIADLKIIAIARMPASISYGLKSAHYRLCLSAER